MDARGLAALADLMTHTKQVLCTLKKRTPPIDNDAKIGWNPSRLRSNEHYPRDYRDGLSHLRTSPGCAEHRKQMKVSNRSRPMLRQWYVWSFRRFEPANLTVHERYDASTSPPPAQAAQSHRVGRVEQKAVLPPGKQQAARLLGAAAPGLPLRPATRCWATPICRQAWRKGIASILQTGHHSGACRPTRRSGPGAASACK